MFSTILIELSFEHEEIQKKTDNATKCNGAAIS